MMFITNYLNQQGFRAVDDACRARIALWMEWYRGRVERFHRYSVYNGIRQVGVERASLGMAKTVCEDWANLLLNERVGIAAGGAREQALLDGILHQNRFFVEGNRAIERAFALGTGAFSEWVDGDGRVRIDYHDARSIFPLRWEGSRVTECAFSGMTDRGLYLRMYRQGDRGTHISNRWFDPETGRELPAPSGVCREVETGIDAPLFQLIEPNIANNFDPDCPMGVSVFANAIDALKAVDIAFDSFRSEYLLGRKRLLVPMSMLRLEQTRDGERAPIFDPNDLVYTAYEAGESADFHDLSPEIRAQQHVLGLKAQLNLLSVKCGLGTGRYDFDRAGGVKTATQVISEQSDLYQSVRKHELGLDAALRELSSAALQCAGAKVSAADVRVTFDDSIIQDKASLRAEARDEVARGLMSKRRYLTEIRGLADDAADEELQTIAGQDGD